MTGDARGGGSGGLWGIINRKRITRARKGVREDDRHEEKDEDMNEEEERSNEGRVRRWRKKKSIQEGNS